MYFFFGWFKGNGAYERIGKEEIKKRKASLSGKK